MAKLTKLQRSLNAHDSLAKTHGSISRDLEYGSKKHFYHLVKSCYHREVRDWQKDYHNIATKDIKSKIYKHEEKEFAKYLKERNIKFSEKNYVPKKYRKD